MKTEMGKSSQKKMIKEIQMHKAFRGTARELVLRNEIASAPIKSGTELSIRIDEKKI